MIRVIDIETTGVDPTADAIVEIASIDMVKGGGVTNRMQAIVDPGRPIPATASAVHHIIDADVNGAPLLREAIHQFMGGDIYVAHNAEFEQGFFAASGIELRKWLCTYKCALRVWPELASHSNQALRYEFGIVTPFGYARDAISVHRAGSDVIVTAAVFERLLDEAKWSDMVAWSQEPALHTKLHFGKHRGQRYDAVDPSYLDWILRQQDMDAGVRFSAQHWLRQAADAIA